MAPRTLAKLASQGSPESDMRQGCRDALERASGRWPPAPSGDRAGQLTRPAASAGGRRNPTGRALELTLPDGSTGTRRLDYGVGSDGGAFLRLLSDGRAGLRIVARAGRAVALWEHVKGRYAETAYAGGMQQALEALEAPQVQLWAPAAVVAAQGGDEAEFLDALRFGIPQPVTPRSVRAVTAEDGRPLIEVELSASNGTATLGLEKDTGRPATLRAVLGEGGHRVSAVGTFSFGSGDPAGELDWPKVDGVFLASRGLEIEAIVDHGDAIFAAFHNPGLPSLVIVGPDGRLAEYHSGVLEDMTARVRARVLQLLREAD